MNFGKTIFAQLMGFVAWSRVIRIVDRCGGNAGIRLLSCAQRRCFTRWLLRS